MMPNDRLWFTRGMGAIPRSATIARQNGRASDGGSGGMASSLLPIVKEKTPTTVACFRVSLEGCTPLIGTCYFPVFSGAIPSLRIVLSCNERERRGAGSGPRL